MIGGHQMAMMESKRRSWSIEERQRIVDEALSPGASVAATAQQHGVSANPVFTWIRREREGWLDRRRGPRSRASLATPAPTPGFLAVEIVAPTPALAAPVVAAHFTGAPLRRAVRRGGDHAAERRAGVARSGCRCAGVAPGDPEDQHPPG